MQLLLLDALLNMNVATTVATYIPFLWLFKGSTIQDLAVDAEVASEVRRWMSG
jgi:hypothetical protein